jgi:HEAT repeat protein
MAYSSSEPSVRALALYGLSELPWRDFRAHLLAGLKDPSPQVNTAAIAFAGEHQDDAEVGRLLGNLSSRPPRELLETGDWLDRLGQGLFCRQPK